MASNSDFAAQAELDRTAAFVAANRATICTRCGEQGVLNKRGHCFSCNEKRLASMRTDTPVLHNAIPLGESAMACNQRLARVAAERQARQPATTVYSLLGGGGIPLVQGADLNHCSSAVSARANLAETVKHIGKYESYLIIYPNSIPAWEAYERMYARIEGFVRDIKTHEAAVKANWPDLVSHPIQIPQKLERAIAPDWLTV